MKRREFLAAGVAAAASSLGAAQSGKPSARSVSLANPSWTVEIDPATLAITVTPAGLDPCQVSRGVAGHRYHELVQGRSAASWRWDEHFRVACTLSGPDLSITITTSQAGTLSLIDQPAQALGRGMLLPIAEGYYVAADDTQWRSELAGREAISSSEDLSLPLWGLDRGGYTLHWLLTNPFNSELRFTDGIEGLQLGLTHSFTSLAPDTPMTMLLHLGGADLLAGSKRYRRHLIEAGNFRTLAEKVRATPSAARLVGASHLYLWDNGLIGVKDVRDWPGFVARLQSGDGIARQIRERFESPPAADARQMLVRMFNGAIHDLARLEWQKEEVDSDRLVAVYAEIREQIVDSFGPMLAPDPAAWGSGLSKASFAAFKAAGLERLWIGLGDGWEGGLLRPEAVRAAGEQGYLIGPYDSYETAIPPGQRPDWATAQLGRQVYEQCAVIGKDGKPTAGFQRTGHYTNSGCTFPILKERVSRIAKAAGFNSWFLDVLGTGMVFDDYRLGRPTTMAENAANNIASVRWVSESLQLPTGSEGGNAVGAQGAIFAHGIETPLFGWGDPDLRRNSKSPFHFGNWYPPEAPTVFFKPVPIKEPYRSLYFDPTTRLPLCQGVFHGSVIASHQWGFDQLKFSNVAADRSLLQQLYNVAPLFHVSGATLGERLPAIRRHDAFFRPMHERLALQAMEGFEWLSEDRLAQRTRFEDGTELIANFAETERHAGDIRLPARSVTALVEGKPARLFQA